MEEKNIIWLASYPKSGNTWFRAFLTALLRGGEVDINNMSTDGIFSSKEKVEYACDVDTDELLDGELNRFRSAAWRYLSAKKETKLLVKTHDAYMMQDGEPVIPADVTQCAVYLVRNPLDVAVSFANHNNSSIEDTVIRYVNNPKGYLSKRGSSKQMLQHMFDWSGHVESWLQELPFPVYVLRYEDMLTNTFEVFRDVVRNMGLSYTDAAIHAAIEASSFDVLSRQESERGFQEKAVHSPKFFNRGRAGSWKDALTGDIATQISTYHAAVMRKMGY